MSDQSHVTPSGPSLPNAEEYLAILAAGPDPCWPVRADDALDDVRADPIRGVSREPRAAIWVEASRRDDEAEAAFLDEVFERNARFPVLHRDADRQPEVCEDEVAEGCVISVSHPAGGECPLFFDAEAVMSLRSERLRWHERWRCLRTGWAPVAAIL